MLGAFVNASTGTNSTVTVVLDDVYPEALAVRVNVYVPGLDALHVTVDPLMLTLSPPVALLEA